MAEDAGPPEAEADASAEAGSMPAQSMPLLGRRFDSTAVVAAVAGVAVVAVVAVVEVVA